MHNPRNTIPIFEIQSKRSRLLTSAAARLRSTDFPRLPHCLGRFAPCGFSRPPALRRADYRCQSADADLPSSKPVSSILSVLFLQNRHLLYICGEIKVLSKRPCSHSHEKPPIPKKWRYFGNIIKKIGDIFGIDS